jgi:hypothetical protein
MGRDGQIQAGPRIIEAFQEYTPPFNAAKAVHRMLKVVPQKFLWGLHSIVLTNVSALSREDRKRKTWGRKRVTLGGALGWYSPGEPARVTILVDNIEKRAGRKWLRLGIVRDFQLSEVLYHELGHHIHRIHKPEFMEKEDVADRWSRKLSSKFVRERYWYLFPLAAPIALVLGLKKDLEKLLHRRPSSS